MSDPKGQDRSTRIELSRPAGGGRLEIKKTVESGMVRQSFSHGRSKAVAVEVKRARPVPGQIARATPPAAPPSPAAPATPPPAAVRPTGVAPNIVKPLPPQAVAATPAPEPVAPPVVAEAPLPTPEAPPPVVSAPAVEPPPATPVKPPVVETPSQPVDVAPEPVAASEPASVAPVVPAPAPVAAEPPARPMTAGGRMTAPPTITGGGRMTAPPTVTGGGRMTAPPTRGAEPSRPTARGGEQARSGGGAGRSRMLLKPLTDEEKAVRLRALSEARKVEDEARKRAEENARRAAEEQLRRRTEEEAAARRKAEEEARKKADEDARRKAEEQARKLLDEEERRAKDQESRQQATAARRAAAEGRPVEEAVRKPAGPAPRPGLRTIQAETEDDDKKKAARGKAAVKRPGAGRPEKEREVKKPARLLLDEDDRQRVPSLAALRRHRERERRQMMGNVEAPQFAREVVLPETITVQELAARMAVRSTDVVKVLMKNGIMAGPAQVIDADTAELVVGEYGHKVKRVSEADVEIGIEGLADVADDLVPRPPVVTVMGHVDHGKTSLLDALRSTNVVAGEAGGITQHIGAYQVDIGHGRPVTFIDTPGHAAFTAMRARGASVTDIVVLVVAADDGVMPQTIEAIRHAKAAKVPIVVAINKIDKPEANPDRVKQELLSHDVVVEDFGGDVQSVPVSAVKRTGLEQLIEAIQLQAELLDLRANPNREAQGAIIEAKLDRGRGVAATVLVQRGTLKVGDIVVCGAAWGRVRALIDSKGDPIDEAGPSVPVEILGLDGVPEAGDIMQAVDSERRAREISEYRSRKKREQAQVVATGARSSLEDIFSALKSGESKELAVVIKSDVHGSLEAITAGLDKLKNDEVSVRILHGGVGAITESDVTLAVASRALIVGFNVRANAQARDLAKREGIDIRYYSIIYELLDEAKQMLSGMLAPEAREIILGHADVREVFNITKVGKIAGCRVTDGMFKRTARARLLRDDTVIFDGMLGSLKRFKDDVREVKEGFECGMSLEGYNDLRQGDVIEAYEVQEVARSL